MSQTQNRKGALDVIHELYLSTVRWMYLIVLFSLLTGIIFIIYKVYLYFKSNSLPEIGMDFLIVSLPLIFGYSLYKQIKRVRQGGKVWVTITTWKKLEVLKILSWSTRIIRARFQLATWQRNLNKRKSKSLDNRKNAITSGSDTRFLHPAA